MTGRHRTTPTLWEFVRTWWAYYWFEIRHTVLIPWEYVILIVGLAVLMLIV